MKYKLFLLTILFLSIFIACNQSKTPKESESEASEVQQEEAAEPVSVKGKIINSETGEAVAMGFITIKGTTTATMSGSNGEFVIQAPATAKKLVIGAKGFESLDVDIIADKELEVKLKPKTE